MTHRLLGSALAGLVGAGMVAPHGPGSNRPRPGNPRRRQSVRKPCH